jgi:hypothetical protein
MVNAGQLHRQRAHRHAALQRHPKPGQTVAIAGRAGTPMEMRNDECVFAARSRRAARRNADSDVQRGVRRAGVTGPARTE